LGQRREVVEMAADWAWAATRCGGGYGFDVVVWKMERFDTGSWLQELVKAR
jgi:hypothetical protein